MYRLFVCPLIGVLVLLAAALPSASAWAQKQGGILRNPSHSPPRDPGNAGRERGGRSTCHR
jgi:hypothetical protein